MNVFPRYENLSGEWEFTYTPEISDMEFPNCPPKSVFTAKMEVPAYWDDHLTELKNEEFMSSAKYNEDYRPASFTNYLQLEGEAGTLPDTSLPFLNGVGYYRRELEYPEELTSGKITLEVGQVSLEAWVWLNGELLYYHFGHSTPFRIRLDKHYWQGMRNELVIAVRNTRRDRLGFNLRGYCGYSGGISRPVTLKFSGRASIADAYLYSSEENRRIHWSVRVEGLSDFNALSIHWLFRNPENSEIVREGIFPVSEEVNVWQSESSGLSEWSDVSPRLYELEVMLIDKDCNRCIDSISQKFGLRNICAQGYNLFLNGSPLMLRGVTDHCYFPLTCKPPFEIGSYREMLRRVKTLGFNWVRFHTWVPSEEYMVAADELGMMIQVEPPVGFGQEEWLDILRNCRRHPSVIIYCCGNEEWLDEEKIRQLGKLSHLMHREVPDALFNPQEALRGIEYCWNYSDFGSGVVEIPFQHNPTRLESIKEFSDVFGQYSWGEVSYTSVTGDWRRIQSRMHLYERPCLSHEVGIIGSYIDLDLEKRYEGTRTGTGLYRLAREGLENAGLLGRAPLFYRNSCAWSRCLRKQAIETVRKCPYYAGYDYLGAIDHHNHQTGYNGGIMNEFYELKYGDSTENILAYNGASVLLLDYSTYRNLTFNDEFKMELFVSLYGGNDLSEGYLMWSVKDENQQVLRYESRTVGNVKNGAVSLLGTISFSVPTLDNPGKITLHTHCFGIGYDIENSWEFWAFPMVQEAMAPDVKTVASLDEESISYLEQGGRVILFGDAPFRSIALDFQISKPGRVHGNLATVINDHPVSNAFPHEGFCSWQFYAMFEKGASVVFEDPEIHFSPIIEVASSYKSVKKQSCMFEFNVGSGKLFVCSLSLDTLDVASRYLKAVIVKYATGKEFNPVQSVNARVLRRLVGDWKKEYQRQSAQTVQAFDPNAQLK